MEQEPKIEEIELDPKELRERLNTIKAQLSDALWVLEKGEEGMSDADKLEKARGHIRNAKSLAEMP